MTRVRNLITFAATAAGLLASVTAARAGTVLISESAASGHRYEVITDSSITWNQAAAAALADGGYLATVGDATEQAFVNKLLADANAPTGSYWFGLHETATEGKYEHITGVTPGYTHWDIDQPDNFGNNEESGSILWSHAGDPTFDRRGFWNDLPNAGGYPQVASVYPDLTSAGYIVEFHGTNPEFENGDGDSQLVQGGHAVPLPAAAGVFPLGALLAGYAARRFKRGAGL